MEGKELKNKAQIRRYLLSRDKLVFVVDYILNKIYETNRDIVDRVVYCAYSPTMYQRTDEFKEAWGQKRSPSASGVHVKGEFEYIPDKMSTNPDLAQHASPEPPYDDSRQYLADIIYYGLSGALFGNGGWRKKRDAWNTLLNELGDDKISSFAEQGFRNAGLNIRLNSVSGMGVKR